MKENEIISEDLIVNKIFFIREEKVMLDNDLAELYDVETKYLKRQVRRNIDRFPEDFMFELTSEEYESLRSQFGTLKRGEHAKYLPYAFTEQGVAQLSSVLNSDRAIKVNIQIIRLFTKMRKLFFAHKELILKLQKMEGDIANQSQEIKLIFEYLKQLLTEKNMRDEQESRRRIGFSKDKD